MNSSNTLETLYQHHCWANLRILELCADLTKDQLVSTLVGTYGSASIHRGPTRQVADVANRSPV